MKIFPTNSSLWLCLLALALSSGCEKKKPNVPPPPLPAPSATPTQSPTPEAQEAQRTEESPTAAQGTPPPDPGQAADAEKTKPKPARPRPSAKKPQQPAPNTTARNTPPRVVVKPENAEPAATPGQISPSPPNTEVSHDQATTEQLLTSSESSVNNIKRTLNADEQAIVTQIRDYVSQSRQAIKDNDLTRAHTLALKAHLLSDELTKRR